MLNVRVFYVHAFEGGVWQVGPIRDSIACLTQAYVILHREACILRCA